MISGQTHRVCPERKTGFHFALTRPFGSGSCPESNRKFAHGDQSTGHKASSGLPSGCAMVKLTDSAFLFGFDGRINRAKYVYF